MRKLIFIFILIIKFSIHSFSQSNTSIEESPIAYKNTIGFEATTWGFIGSYNINMEFLISKPKFKSRQMFFRSGLTSGYINPIFGKASKFQSIHLGFTYLFGPKSHHLEFNYGIRLNFPQTQRNENTFGAFRSNNSIKSLIPLAQIGYRYQRPKGGFFFSGKVGIIGMAISVGTYI